MREDHVVEGVTYLAYPRAIKMKDSETIKEYLDKLSIVSKIGCWTGIL